MKVSLIVFGLSSLGLLVDAFVKDDSVVLVLIAGFLMALYIQQDERVK